MFERILLATDGSPDARTALAYARDLALRDGAQVIVVHAFKPVPTYLGDPWQEQIIASNVAAAEQITDEAAQELQKAGLEPVVEVLEGPAADAILRVAEVRQCDLIVMGCRGYSILTSLLVGSVSHRVLAHARVPVLIVRAPQPAEG